MIKLEKLDFKNIVDSKFYVLGEYNAYDEAWYYIIDNKDQLYKEIDKGIDWWYSGININDFNIETLDKPYFCRGFKTIYLIKSLTLKPDFDWEHYDFKKDFKISDYKEVDSYPSTRFEYPDFKSDTIKMVVGYLLIKDPYYR